jgi:hypothetical protein
MNVGVMIIVVYYETIKGLDGIPGTRVTGHPCPGTLVPRHFFREQVKIGIFWGSGENRSNIQQTQLGWVSS